jgi:hypothetical protein
MSARHKLNSICFGIAAVFAALIGLMFKSFVVFAVSLGGLVAAMLHAGTVRPSPKHPSSRKSRTRR